MVDWISKAEYAKATDKSSAEVQRLIDEGLLDAKLTDGGGKWMVKIERNEDIQKLLSVVAKLSEQVNKLSTHLGIRG